MTWPRAHWYKELGEHLDRRYGRTAAECREQERLAGEAASLVRRAIELTHHLILGREASPKLQSRLELCAESLERIADRDRRFAQHLEEQNEAVKHSKSLIPGWR